MAATAKVLTVATNRFSLGIIVKTPIRAIISQKGISSWRFAATCLDAAKLKTKREEFRNLHITKPTRFTESFHSDDIKDNDSPGNSEREESRILDASLAFVHEYGWTRDAISAGARSLDLPGTIHGIFPRGAYDLVAHFEQTSNDNLLNHLEELTSSKETSEGEAEPLLPHQVVEAAVRYRLALLEPYIGTWTQALSVKADPQYLPSALHSLARMLDDIWYFAGDRSTEMDWYTKRGLLAAVYCSTELYMTQDKSENFEETYQFLTRRLKDVKEVGHSFIEFGECTSQGFNILYGACKTISNIVGGRSAIR